MSAKAILDGLIAANEAAFLVEDLVDLYGRVVNGDVPTEEEIDAKAHVVQSKIDQERERLQESPTDEPPS